MADVHLGPGTVNGSKFFDRPEFGLCRPMQDHVCIFQLAILLIEMGEFNPDSTGFADSLLCIYRLNGLSERFNRQVNVMATQLQPRDPLLNIVWVLTENHVRQ